MKIKTSELTGPALNWASAKADGWSEEGLKDIANGDKYPEHDFSTDWSQGGPIIDREDIDIISVGVKNYRGRIEGGNPTSGYGPTRLIAAMRCLVTSKLGYEVDIPDELLTKSDIIRALHPDATELKVTSADPADFTGFPTLKP